MFDFRMELAMEMCYQVCVKDFTFDWIKLNAELRVPYVPIRRVLPLELEAAHIA